MLIGCPHVIAGCLSSGVDKQSYAYKIRRQQFTLEDSRSLEEVVHDMTCCRWVFILSWCTVCYRKGRTGATFMKIAQTGRCPQEAGLSLSDDRMAAPPWTISLYGDTSIISGNIQNYCQPDALLTLQEYLEV